MFELLATLTIFAVAISAMSIGVIFSDRRLKGSCGGLNNLRKLLGETPCAGCTESGPDCPLREPKSQPPKGK
jgi:hypothetical protein